MHIKADGYIEKASKLAEGEVEFVVSTGDWDAHGERINVAGIDLKDFKKNPVVLWGHDGFNLPIAKATKIWKQDDKLMARALFKINDEFPRKVYEYILEGFISAVSIGGMVEEWGHDGLTIAKLKMKEFSVVSIPANASAMVANKSFTDEKQSELRGMANLYARKMFTRGDDELHRNIEVLETLVATLKEVAVTGETHEAQADDTPKSRRVVLRQAQAVDQQVEEVIRHIKLNGTSTK
jgi:HK97 family phage prohead protease